MLKTAKLHGVGSGTVQRISRELATRTQRLAPASNSLAQITALPMSNGFRRGSAGVIDLILFLFLGTVIVVGWMMLQ